MPNFACRSLQPELIDDFTLSGETLSRNLRELEYINAYLGGNAVTLKGVKYFVKRLGTPISIADVGCGGGDTLGYLSRWAGRYRYTLQLSGYDANPFIVEYALKRHQDYPDIRYYCLDVWSKEFEQVQPDVFLLSLFCHHFGDEQLKTLLARLLHQARKGIIINDLQRHPMAYYSIRWLARLLGGSHLLQHDAPLSVLKGFRKEELQTLLQEIAPKKFQISWHWAFRYLVIIEK
ncbi:MAG: methyltransferase domain-containing protein [Cytophagales bacterium]|nr:methyltransferase domain-containing protein [Bernardetiaceae bacterium]MDW8210573.1 methyltransferase domain-containing protein [Cytophagales bacterium]